MKNIKIIGTGSYLPQRIVSNNDLEKIMDTNDEWIFQRTGIHERRVAVNETCADLAANAAKKALENAKLSVDDIDLIIVATCTPDFYCPSVACIVQERIDAKNAVSFDVSAACTGFIFALETAKKFLESSTYKNALVIGSEVMSKLINFENRNTAVLFGDGAGAVVVSKCNLNNIGGVDDVYIKTHGKGTNLITMPATSSISEINFDNFTPSYGYELSRDILMEGREVFKFATSIIEIMINECLKKNNLLKNQIKYIVPHQANMRIIDYASKKLKIDNEVFYKNIENYANTSAASIPIALDEMNRNGLLDKDDKVILVGFGGGLSFGYALLSWSI